MSCKNFLTKNFLIYLVFYIKFNLHIFAGKLIISNCTIPIKVLFI